jgi:DNA primase
LLFDGDSAGQRAAARALAPMAESGLDAGVVLLPTEHDPDSFLTAFGDAALRQALEDAEPLLKFCCRRIQDEGRSSRDRAAAFEEVVRALKRVPNRFQRQLWLQEFSALTGFSAEVIAGAGVEPTAAAAGSGPVPPSAAAVAATSPGAGAEAGGEPRGEEEMLLCLAFESESVYEMLRTYEGPPLISNGLLRDLLEEQFVVHGGSKSAGDVAHVLDSIQDDALRQRLQVTLLRVGELDQAVQLQAARDCMRKILIRGFEARKRDLSLRIAEAAERQDRETLENLLREKSELLQKSPSRTNLNP